MRGFRFGVCEQVSTAARRSENRKSFETIAEDESVRYRKSKYFFFSFHVLSPRWRVLASVRLFFFFVFFLNSKQRLLF